MLYITNYEKTITENLFSKGYPIIEKDTTGNFTLTMDASEKDNPYSFGLIVEESIITANGFDFRIKQMERNSRKGSKSVLAQHVFFDNVWRRQETTNGGTKTLNEFATFALQGTGWNFTSDVQGMAQINGFGRDNVVKLVSLICEAFECEVEIISNSKIHFSKQLGPDNDFVYRYGDNIIALDEKVSTDNLRTYIEATGKDDVKVSFTSENASRWGIRKADPVSDERFTDSTNLLKKARESLQDEPEVSIELESVELLDRQLGERVWLIHEPMNFELQSRILKLNQIVVPNSDKFKTISVTIGNKLPKSLSEIVVETEKEIAETDEKLEESIQEYRSRFEVTDSNIILEVENINKSIATIDLKADAISLSVNNRITSEVARIDIQANQIQSTVTSQQGELYSQQSQITQNANNISSKVSQTDYNGNTIASLINQTATSITIQASKIELRGSVSVLSDITGDMGTIYAGSIQGGTININTDARVGNNLYLGQGGGYKAVQFGSGAVISYNGNFMELSSPNVRLNGTNNELDGYNAIYGTLNVPSSTSLSGIVRAESLGLGLSYLGGILYVKVNGSIVGSVKLT